MYYFQYGHWQYNVTNLQAYTQRLAITVSAKAVANSGYPIIAQIYWAKSSIQDIGSTSDPEKQTLYASVTKGMNYFKLSFMELCIL